MNKETTIISESLVRAESIAHDILRPELFTILQQAASTQRYTALGLSPESIKGQNVKNHTLRMMLMVDNLSICEETKGVCRKTIAIHDLPETIDLARLGKTSDITSPEKALSPNLDDKIEKDEEKAARTIFDPDELNLYLAFSQAGDFLKNRSQIIPTTTGLISKILDKIDADLGYHQAAILSLDYQEVLTAKGQSLAFDQYVPFSNKLDILKNTPIAEIAIICQQLIDNTMQNIIKMWQKVPEIKIPLTIRNCLNNF